METEQDTKTVKRSTAYDSNPFTAALTGLQKLVKSNSQTVVGVALFNILLTTLLVVTAGVIFLAVITFVAKHDDALGGMYAFPANSALGFLSNMSDGSIYVTWILGFAVCVFLMALMQSLQLNLTIAAAHQQALKFGVLVKQSARTALPILGFVGLMLLAGVIGAIVIGLLSIVLGYITLVVGAVAVLAAIYAGMRLSYTVFIIVDDHLAPVAAMKQSWETTEGHLIETIGSAFTAMLVLTVPDIVFTALARVTEGVSVLSGIFSIISAVVTTVLVIGATMVMAERYTQIRQLKQHGDAPLPLSSFNYLAIILALFLSFILNALSPKTDSTYPIDNTYQTPSQNTNNSYPTQLN